MDERRLLRNLKKGRRDALEKAIDYYTPYVSVIVYQMAGRALTRDDMEEVVSEVFLCLWEQVKYVEEKTGIRSCLETIAQNKAKQKLQNYQPEKKVKEWKAPAFAGISDAGITQKEEGEMIWSLVMDLGVVDSEIFFRYFHYDEGVREISKRTGLTSATVETKLVHSRQQLRRRLTEMGREAL